MHPHPFEAIPLSPTISVALIEQWERQVADRFPHAWRSAPHLSETLVARTLTSSPFPRRVTRFSLAGRDHLLTQVRQMVSNWSAYWDEVEVPGRMSIVLVRLALLALSPDCLALPYRAFSANEQSQVTEAMRIILHWLRKIRRGFTHSGIAEQIALETFLRPYRAESAQFMFDDLQETAELLYHILDQWRMTLVSTTRHPSEEECEHVADLVLRVLLGQVKRDVFSTPLEDG